MNSQKINSEFAANPKMLPMVLSIAGNLVLWTLGFATMSVATENIPQRAARPSAHKVIQEFPIDPARAENLQHWVDAGHDTWCRDAKLVAQAALQRIAPEFSAEDFQLASVPAETRQLNPGKAIYTYHSLDGHTAYRITVVRYPSLSTLRIQRTPRFGYPLAPKPSPWNPAPNNHASKTRESDGLQSGSGAARCIPCPHDRCALRSSDFSLRPGHCKLFREGCYDAKGGSRC